jgi:hypothetical protein
MANREWTYKAKGRGGKAVTYTEAELKSREYRFGIADGFGFYQIKSIGRQSDPIVSLVPSKRKHTCNYADGRGERLERLSRLIAFSEWEKLMELKGYENAR